MRQDFFVFRPQFKLVIAGNHKPAVRSVDEALRARLQLIPFAVTIPVEERDQELSQKLEREWSAILRWAIDGCLAWQARGLDPPACVRQATDDYLTSEDVIAQWLEDCCVRKPSAKCESGALYASWKQWARQAGEADMSQTQFSKQLVAKGFEKARQSGGRRAFTGLSLKGGGPREAAE